MNIVHKVITPAFAFITFLSITIDAFFHPSAMINRIGVDSLVVLAAFVVYSIIMKLSQKKYLSANILHINKKYIFPATLFLFLFFSLLENAVYENYSLLLFRVHFEEFLFIPILSGVILYFGINISKLSLYQKCLYFFAPIFLLTIEVLNVFHENIRQELTREDGPFELLQFVLFLTSGILSLTHFRNSMTKSRLVQLFWLIVGVGMLFVAFEEISWGQRIFGVETPVAIKDINYQDETTLHNIGFIQTYIYIPYIAIAIWGVVGHRFMPKYSPSKYLVVFFATVGIYYFTSEFMFFYYELATADMQSVGKWQEPSELLLAIGMTSFIYDRFKRLS